jgi:hypothetical protein
VKRAPAQKTRSNVKLQVMKKSIIVMVVNVLSFSTVLVVEGLQRTGYRVDSTILLAVTISVMSVSKFCNPWIYTVRLIMAMVSTDKRKR